MIRLCIITTTPVTIRAFFGNQLGFLRNNGYDVTIITSPIRTSSNNYGYTRIEGIRYEDVRMERIIKPIEDIRALFRIFHLLKYGRFDIVKFATPKAALLGSIASWFAQIPVRIYHMWGLYYVTQKGIRMWIFKFIEKIICRLSTNVTTDSKGNFRYALDEGLCIKTKLEVIHYGSANGVDTTRFDPQKLITAGIEVRDKLLIPRNAHVFGSITPIVGDKGVNELISAFIQIVEEYDNVYLLLIGDAEQKDPVSEKTLQIINSHSKIKNISFQIAPENYLAGMNYFVLPTYREGFGVVNIEAGAMELPVVSTNIPGPQESIIDGKTGILVPPRKGKPLVNAMKKLLADPVLAKKLGVKGRKRVKKCYEQRQLWYAILNYQKNLLIRSRRFRQKDGELFRI